MSTTRAWLGYMKRIVLGRPTWSADREFAYYSATPAVIRQHEARQESLERQVFAPALRVVQALGVLDSHLLRGARVLDLGAGECWAAEAIALLGGASEVWAADAVPKQIWAAAAKYASHDRLKFVIADAGDLPFADGQFDLVVSNLFLHHVHPLEGVLSEIMRVLVAGGRFAALEPNPLLGALVHEKTSENEAPLSPHVIVRAAERVGFASVRHKYWWSKLDTSLLGPFSPGYRLESVKPGSHRSEPISPVALRRPLRSMSLQGLLIDSACKFAGLANSQAEQILASRNSAKE